MLILLRDPITTQWRRPQIRRAACQECSKKNKKTRRGNHKIQLTNKFRSGSLEHEATDQLINRPAMRRRERIWNTDLAGELDSPLRVWRTAEAEAGQQAAVQVTWRYAIPAPTSAAAVTRRGAVAAAAAAALLTAHSRTHAARRAARQDEIRLRDRQRERARCGLVRDLAGPAGPSACLVSRPARFRLPCAILKLCRPAKLWTRRRGLFPSRLFFFKKSRFCLFELWAESVFPL